MQRLERPQNRLHERRVESLVVVLEIDPTRLAGHIRLPLFGVLEHRLTAGRIELVDPHLQDLVLIRHAELLHRFKLSWQTVRIPPEAALDAAATLRLIAGHEVLDVASQKVAVMRQAVSERRAVIENKLVLAALALINRGLERAVLFPELEDALLDRREMRRRRGLTRRVSRYARIVGFTGIAHWRPSSS